MRTWTHSKVREVCGLCNTTVAPGDPFVRVTIASLKRSLVRCPACSGLPPEGDAVSVQTEGSASPIRDKDSSFSSLSEWAKAAGDA